MRSVSLDATHAYDGLCLLELNSTGTTETSNFSIGYLYEADNQTPTSASYETTDTTTPFTLESNVRGDVIALRDKSGVIFARYIYSEYGVRKAIEINATENIDETLAQAIAHNQPLRYAGYVYDEYSKMYYCAARYYDPVTQVFISLDPVRADGERSGYLYCNGDPVNRTDPSGEMAVAIAGVPVVIDAGIAITSALAVAAIFVKTKVISMLYAYSQTMSNSLSKGKKPKKPKNNERHHIMAQGDRRAAPARWVLKRVGIKIHSSVNTVYLKYGMHRRTHTNNYYALVNTAVTASYDKGRTLRYARVRTAMALLKGYLRVKSLRAAY